MLTKIKSQGNLKIADSIGKCDIHNTSLMQFKEDIFCPFCRKEKADAELAESVREEVEYRKKLEIKATLSRLSIFDGDESFKATLEDFKAETKEEKNVLQWSNLLIDEIKDTARRKDSGINAWFIGPPGSGKTHLAMSILKDINKLGRFTCLYASSKLMFSLIRESFSDQESMYTEQYIINLLSKVDVLVIDDIGKETGSENTNRVASDFVTRVLNTVVDQRKNKVTIYTTNLSFDKLTAMYDPALIDRMKSNYRLMKFSGIQSKRGMQGGIIYGE